MEWILYFAIIALAVVIGNWLIPVEHQRNYKQCPKPGAYWFAALCSVSIPIVAAIQSVVDPFPFPFWARPVGALYMAGGYALQIWAWRVNFFLLPIIVYIPPEFRATDGPYRFSKHPYYWGICFAAWGSVTLLGQWWALFPLVVYLALILWRVHAENRILFQPPSL